jgi:hypothetical protein
MIPLARLWTWVGHVFTRRHRLAVYIRYGLAIFAL